MNKEQTLKAATDYFKAHHPGITPEAILCFLVLAGSGDMSIADIAGQLNMPPQDARAHLDLLMPEAGAGLVAFAAPGTGSSVLTLSPAGMAARDALNTVLAGQI